MSTPNSPQPAPQAFPTPPDFPVQWNNPEEAQYFWTQDRMHFPDIATPLEAAMMGDIHNLSFNVPLAALGMPVRMHFMAPNGYIYTAMAPPPGPPPEDLHAAEQHVQEQVGAAIGSLEQRWSEEWLPEVQRHLRWWESIDPRTMSMSTLVDHFDETWSRMLVCWEIHFSIALPMLMAMSQFDEMHRELFGSKSVFDSFKLLQGFDNKSIEAGHALWRLSRQALSSPEVRRVLHEEEADTVVSTLERSEAGRGFLADFRRYLDEFGQRGDKFVISPPSWIEDPRPAVRMLKDYAGQVDHDPAADHAALGDERDRLVAQARDRLQSYPRQVADQFDSLLRSAQVATRLQEDHNYWIDQRAMYQVRRVVMELGRRYVEVGVLAEPGDIFYLKPDEIRATGREAPTINRSDVVAERKAELERCRRLEPPPALGTMPAGPPPDNALFRAAGKFWGAPPRQEEDPNVMHGGSGSPGIMRGPARIVRSLREAGKLHAGDVLVAETTAPPWTPLFATAAAIVTDTGGVLSHCAIVAREYRIPAVVGVGHATTTLRDGQLVEVDGDAGLVRILADA